MGGGGQTNSGQATQAAKQQTDASTQDMALSKQNQAQQAQLFSGLFGNGKPGSTGSLTSMMDPKSLNTGAPTGAYQTAWNNAQNQIGKSYAQQRGSLAQTLANQGMSSNNTPSGFQADQQRQLGSSEADTRGSTYTGITGQQHSDALNNFWNANNIAAGQSANASNSANVGAGNSGSSSASLYGTAGAYHPGTMGNVLGSAIGAGGTVGAAAMCPAEGAKVLMADHSRKAVEKIRKGDMVMGIDRAPDEVLDDPIVMVQHVISILTRDFGTRVSWTHAFMRSAGGYAIAVTSLGEVLDTDAGPRPVLAANPSKEKAPTYHLLLKRSHGFNIDGIWSLE